MNQGNQGTPCCDPIHKEPAGILDRIKAEKTRQFATGATRDVDQTKLDYEGFLSPKVLRRYAEYMHEARTRNVPEGLTIRQSDNWQKGIPKDAYMKSMVRHVLEVWESHRGGHMPEPGSKQFQDILCAVIFNAMGYLFEDMK